RRAWPSKRPRCAPTYARPTRVRRLHTWRLSVLPARADTLAPPSPPLPVRVGGCREGGVLAGPRGACLPLPIQQIRSSRHLGTRQSPPAPRPAVRVGGRGTAGRRGNLTG